MRREEKTTFTSTMLIFTIMVILTEEKQLIAVEVQDTFVFTQLQNVTKERMMKIEDGPQHPFDHSQIPPQG